ncbi:hypothetical protein [Blastochloris sulfoviridis]|uniref:Uncharacterized protein n=1 Tax=Blastochloris sulfoviridis TaxID=50712 RepID=A0A5M6HT86_9HYPH|nr:hypothetical protein [Blastochloris sulfoviridis]KAA5599173.1 hypothetical protein F1193_12575 [Blastochloris sulfoviridis]
MDPDRRKEVIEIWKAVIDVQKHFNDIEMRIRGLFITIVLAIAAAQGFLIENDISFNYSQLKIKSVIFAPILGIIASFLFYLMDRYWYHRLLVGAVKHAIEIEKRFGDTLPELCLTKAIGGESPVEVRGRFMRAFARLFVSDLRFNKDKMLHSDGKIELFYKSIGYMFLFVLIGTVLLGGVLISNEPLAVVLWRLT